MISKPDGHRKRLREKFLKSGIDGFHDYEIIELLLTLGTPRRDCKPAAKKALEKFNTLREVLEASPEELIKIDDIGPHNLFGLKLVQEVARKFLKEKILNKPICKSSQSVFDYLYHSLRGLKNEIFKIIFLDAQNKVIETEDLFRGSLSSSFVYFREIIKSALRHNAAGLIFVHNHPSGNSQPSASDKEITRNLLLIGRIMEIKILDHLIIGDNQYFSFADEGLIRGYNEDWDRKLDQH
ncbi:MAG: DNA repair protein RadC [Elusimicrobiota bacterium]